MGIFSSKKNLCPICGEGTPRILPKKIEGQAICGDCALKIDMDFEIEKDLTIDELKEYFLFYNENQGLREEFIVSKKLDFGFFDTKMIFDFDNKLFCMSGAPNKTIFEGAQLKSFTIKEDSSPLFAGSAEGLLRYTSTVPKRISELSPQISMYIMTERLADTIDKDDDDNNRNYRPRVDIPEPFRQFYVELKLEHPYWKTIKCDMSGPRFMNDRPDIGDYMREYQRDIEVMEELSRALMQVAFEGAQEIIMDQGSPLPQATTVIQQNVDSIEEIKRYKSLMEEGIITRDEFDAKKKQLLGI